MKSQETGEIKKLTSLWNNSTAFLLNNMYCSWLICACSTFLLLGMSPGFSKDTCSARCYENYDSNFSCQCHPQCEMQRNCCKDYFLFCTGSCKSGCVHEYDDSLPCQCNPACELFKDCCEDYNNYCGKDLELDKRE